MKHEFIFISMLGHSPCACQDVQLIAMNIAEPCQHRHIIDYDGFRAVYSPRQCHPHPSPAGQWLGHCCCRICSRPLEWTWRRSRGSMRKSERTPLCAVEILTIGRHGERCTHPVQKNNGFFMGCMVVLILRTRQES